MEKHSVIYNNLNFYYKQIFYSVLKREDLDKSVAKFIDEVNEVISTYEFCEPVLTKSELDDVFRMIKSITSKPNIDLHLKVELLNSKKKLVDAFNNSKGITQ